VSQPKTPENPQSPSEYMIEAYSRLADSMQHFLANLPSQKPAAASGLLSSISTVSEVIGGALARPDQLLEIQAQAVKDWTQFWQNMWLPADAQQPVAQPERGDRRFGHEGWNNNTYFNQIKQAHLLAGRQLRQIVQASPERDQSKRALAELAVEQYLNAIAPTNFVMTNPEVVRRTVDTGGANLVSGFANLLEDLAAGRGIVQRRTDEDAFRLGENLACTPGSVVYQNHLMQLIQYAPTTKAVRGRPLLYVPPLVNKYYMIDLQPKSSLVKWLVDQGHTVFVISWVEPDESHRDCGLQEYVGDGVLEAHRLVLEATGADAVDLFGFCMGGTLLTIASAVLIARGQGAQVGSATLIGALVDFADMMEWTAFITEDQMSAVDAHIGERGYIAKDELQQLFSMMRSNDLIWSAFINHYLLDRTAPPSDLLYWFEHGSHIPEAFLNAYNRELLLDDHLRIPGAVTLLGEKLDLSKIDGPVMVIGLKDDHVSSWKSVYRGCRYFGGQPTFILGGSGHNAGVINPPSANKHGYWTNPQMPEDADAWLAGAEKHEGSWWPRWSQWLYDNDPTGTVPPRKPGQAPLSVLEPAPGSFITAR